MTAVVTRTEVERPADEAFAYVIDPSRMAEWQQGVVRGHMDSTPTGVGSRCITVCMIGRPRAGGDHRDHRVRPAAPVGRPRHQRSDQSDVAVKVEPLSDSSRSRITIELDFTGHGIGKLLVPLLVRRQAAREMPENMKRLKQRLEVGG